MLTTWRRLPYLDPGLPLALLPKPWNGVTADELFSALTRLAEPPGGTASRPCEVESSLVDRPATDERLTDLE
jgi:DNA-binding transcriptional regulator PaaX